jgi:hypothetical protein
MRAYHHGICMSEPNEALDRKIDQCRQATQASREAWRRADILRSELKALGLCSHCAVADHGYCRDYGCVCCGGGK